MGKYVIPEASEIYRNWESNRKGFGEKSYKGAILPLSFSSSEKLSAFALENGRGTVMANLYNTDKETLGTSSPYLLALPKLETVIKELEEFNFFRTSLLPSLKGTAEERGIIFYASCNKETKEVNISIRGEDDTYDDAICETEIGGILNWDTLKNSKSWKNVATNYLNQQKEGLVEDGKFNIGLVSAAVANTKKLVIAGEEMDKKEKLLWNKIKNNKNLDDRAKAERFSTLKQSSAICAYDGKKIDTGRL